MDSLQAWQAFVNTMWILAPPFYIPYWACPTEVVRETVREVVKVVVLDREELAEEFVEFTPLPALTDAVQGWLMSADPPIDVITFCD